jgi:Type II CAAX prenyl endopeptidase Rce1-like
VTSNTASSLAAPQRGYFQSTRAPRYSILFALPLLVVYEGLAALLSAPAGGLRNGADALFRSVFTAVAGARGPAVFMAAIILIGVGLVSRDIKRSGQPIRASYFAGMFVESALLAIAFGLVIGTITAQLLGAAHLLAVGAPTGIATLSRPMRLMLSLGAGLYEELFFRVVLVTGLAALGRTVFGFSRGASATVAVILSATLFSLFHYLPPYGDAFQITSFTFRLLSGLAFSALYVTRGFGITAWTHALYDAFLLLF